MQFWKPIPRAASQLAVAFGSVSLMLSLLAGAWLYHAWQSVREDKLESLENMTEFGAASAEVFLRHYERSLPVLARDLLEQWGQSGRIVQRLRRYQQSDPNLSAIYLFSPDGTLLASDREETTVTSRQHIQDPVFRADFDKAKSQERMVIGRTRFGKMVNDWIIPIRMRGADARGNVLFVLSAVVTMRQQSVLWRGIALPTEGEIGLLRDDGYLQTVHPVPAHPEEVFGRKRTGALADGIGAGRLPLKGVLQGSDVPSIHGELLIAYKRLPDFAMTAYACLPSRTVLSAWHAHIRVPLILFAISLAALLLAAYWTIRQQQGRERERNLNIRRLLTSQAKLQRQSQLLEQSQRVAKVGGWEYDVPSELLYWTEESFRIHEVTRDEYKPTMASALAFFSNPGKEQLEAALDRAKQSAEPWDIELELVTRGGRKLWIRSTGRGERKEGAVKRLWGAYQDITDRREAEERIRHLAHCDGLTGLANRNLFITHLAHALGRAAREGTGLAVVFIDLDRFKHINDAMGHDLGDRVLKFMADKLTSTIRSSDLLARWGGDEFIIATEDVSHRESAATLARRILDAVEKPIAVGEEEYVLTASIGIASFPTDGSDGSTLIKNADIAMYRAKEQGKNRFEYYSEHMSSTNVQRLSLETQLKRAIQEGDQFVLDYQPKLLLASQEVSGLEALARWMHPEQGLVLPAEFIQLSEETGLIGRIGAWVLRKACEQAVQWHHAGFESLRVAVNVSARELYGAGFVSEMRRVLSDTGMPANCLEVEITETVMMRNVEQVTEVLRQLKNIGVQLSVDDFGTGYSSLTYMKRFPLDAVKIDRSFVRDIPNDQDNVAITRAVIAMAHSLRVRVVAEGVEAKAQLDFLRELGCDEVQGTLISRPLTESEVLRFLKQQTTQQTRLSIVR